MAYRPLAARAVVIALAALSTVPLSAQSVTVHTERDRLRVRAPGFSFIKGEPLARLKDGRSVRVDIALAVRARPDGADVTQVRTTFVLSYDLWDERFAVTQTGTPPVSVSYLTARDAESWCLDRVTVPLGAIGRLGRDAPLWVRLESSVSGQDNTTPPEDTAMTLRGLIDRLSRRREASDLRDVIEAGPLMLTN